MEFVHTRVNDFLVVNSKEYDEAKLLRYKNKIKKLIFFILNEGLFATIRKVKSKRIEQIIEKTHPLIIAAFKYNEQTMIGIGKQLNLGEIKIFNKNLIFELQSNAVDLKDIALPENILKRLNSYLPVESCPFDDTLPFLITKHNHFLKVAAIQGRLGRESSSQTRALTRLKGRIKKHKKVFLFGYGSYVREYSQKYFKHHILAVVDYNIDLLHRYVKEETFFFKNYRDVLPLFKETKSPIAIIATYHSDHFSIAKSLFSANPQSKVLIEKPLVVNFNNALSLIDLKNKGFWFEVGFNRRYIDWVIFVKNILKCIRVPKIINISIKELLIPNSHWYYWSNQGTRITGNLCHWIDLCYYWLKTTPESLTLLNYGDSVALNILFKDGSLANILASDSGNNLRGVQEKIEIRYGDTTIFINDFKKLILYENGKTLVKEKIFRDKGHDAMYKRFLNATRNKILPQYEIDDIFWVCYLTECASKMLENSERYKKVDITLS